jgi:hypothetical protein
VFLLKSAACEYFLQPVIIRVQIHVAVGIVISRNLCIRISSAAT